MFSNFLFGITCLMYIVITLISSSKPTTGHVRSDEMFLNALGNGFTICSLILTLTICPEGGFDWVSQYGIIRLLLAVIGCLCMAATTYTCAVLRWQWDWYEGEFPQFLRWLSLSNGLKWMTLLMLVPYFILL